MSFSPDEHLSNNLNGSRKKLVNSLENVKNSVRHVDNRDFLVNLLIKTQLVANLDEFIINAGASGLYVNSLRTTLENLNKFIDNAIKRPIEGGPSKYIQDLVITPLELALKVNLLPAEVESFNSFPSPLIWIIHDKNLEEEKKFVLIEALANTLNFHGEMNIHVLAGDPKNSTVNVRSPLMHAVEFCSPAIVYLLIQKGAVVNECHLYVLHKGDLPSQSLNDYPDGDKLFALHLAAKRGSIDILKILLDNRADINAKNVQKRTPLHFAKDAETAAMLLKYNADINAQDNNGDTPLHLICANMPIYTFGIYSEEKISEMFAENIKMMALFINNGALVNLKNNHGYTPLHYAVQLDKCRRKEDVDHIKDKIIWLATNGADVNAITDERNYELDESRSDNPTPSASPLSCLYKARGTIDKKLIKYRTDLAMCLIYFGSDITLCDGNGWTLLQSAARDNDIEAFKYFLSFPELKGLINFQPTPTKPTVLHIVASDGTDNNETLIKLLLENGANPFATFIIKQEETVTKRSFTFVIEGEVAVTPYQYAIKIKNGPKLDGPKLKCIQTAELDLLQQEFKNLQTDNYDSYEAFFRKVEVCCQTNPSAKTLLVETYLFIATGQIQLIGNLDDLKNVIGIIRHAEGSIVKLNQSDQDKFKESIKQAYLEIASRCLLLPFYFKVERKINIASAIACFKKCNADYKIFMLELMDLKASAFNLSIQELSEQYPTEFQRATLMVDEIYKDLFQGSVVFSDKEYSKMSLRRLLSSTGDHQDQGGNNVRITKFLNPFQSM